MFDRYTERARAVIVHAQDTARYLKHNYVGTEHILAGLCQFEEPNGHSLASSVLQELGVKEESVLEQIRKVVGEGGEVTTGQIPFSPGAKKVTELALREALSLGHNYVGTEHILLSVARATDSVGSRILLNFDIEPEEVRAAILAKLTNRRATAKKTTDVMADPSEPEPTKEQDARARDYFFYKKGYDDAWEARDKLERSGD